MDINDYLSPLVANKSVQEKQDYCLNYNLKNPFGKGLIQSLEDVERGIKTSTETIKELRLSVEELENYNNEIKYFQTNFIDLETPFSEGFPDKVKDIFLLYYSQFKGALNLKKGSNLVSINKTLKEVNRLKEDLINLFRTKELLESQINFIKEHFKPLFDKEKEMFEHLNSL